MLQPSPTPGAPLQTVLAEDLDALEPFLASWDQLAVGAGRPFCAPAWMLACWCHGRTGDARLRAVLVLDEHGELVGVGPFFAQVKRFGPATLAEYRLLAAGFSHRLGPLAAPGLERPVAAAIAHRLADAVPQPASVVLEGLDAGDRWAELLAAGWPGRASVRTDLRMDAPAIDLGSGYEAWLERRERKFRKESRRTRRRLEELGVSPRLADDERAVDALLRLHDARWSDRGGSHLGHGAREVVLEAIRRFAGDPGRLSIATLEGPDGTVAAELTVRAGTTMAFWTGGFDPAWSRQAPGTQAMLSALEAAPPEVSTADLGGGAHDYKRRLADSTAPLAWRTVFPVGPRYPLIRLMLAPKHARAGAREVFRRLPIGAQQRIRRALGDRS